MASLAHAGLGLQKEVGRLACERPLARKRDILLEFTGGHHLTALGGVRGVLLGAVITWIIPFVWTSLPATMSTGKNQG